MMRSCILVLAALLLTGCAAKHSAPTADLAAVSVSTPENVTAENTDAVPTAFADSGSLDTSNDTASLDDYEEEPDGATAALASSDIATSSGDEFSLDDYDDDMPSVEVSDPLEPWNRFWFRFNDVMLLNVFKPIHSGYAKVVPEPVRGGISNFAHNLASPVRFLNSLLQGKFTQAGVEFGRFCINTMTSLGLADVASQSKPLYPYHPETENFGHTLAVWGIPEGPYLVWPFFGPSTARGTVGLVGDMFAEPVNYALSWQINLLSSTGFTFNDLDKVYRPYEQVVGASLEPYIAVRNGYLTLLRRIPR